MNQLKPIKIIFILLFLTFNIGFSQEYKSNLIKKENSLINTYYVDVCGVTTKKICLDIENKIALKSGVVSFKTVGFPSKYFVLKASRFVSELEIKDWLSENNLALNFYGNSENSLEVLSMNRKKLNK
ncbi:MAG: hypothetical protein H7174_03085 [Flavobacterium sp.]|nr:hypothetical protein [Flavobacterium sp.]